MILVQRENHIDVDGDVISPKALKANDGKTVPVYRDFNHEQPLGQAKLIYVKGVGLHAELDCIDLHPEDRVVIKFRADKSHTLKTATWKHTRWNRIVVVALGVTMYATDYTLPTIGESGEPAKTGRGVEVPSKPISTRPLRKGVNMREGPITIEVEVCVGCKWLRLDLAFDRMIRGKCVHPASSNGPQSIGIEDTILPSPFETPSWCKHKMIEANLKSLRDAVD